MRRRGQTKRDRFMASRDVTAFLGILGTVFPDACKGDDPTQWDWSLISTAGGKAEEIGSLMAEAKADDDTLSLFRKWDFTTITKRRMQQKVWSYICTIRKSVFY